MQPFWVVLGVATLASRQLLVPSGFPAGPWWAWVGVAGAAALGTLLAHRIAHRVPAHVARATIVVLSLGGGAAVIVSGLAGLLSGARGADPPRR